MKTIKERIWEKATTELNPKFQDTVRNFEYEEPIIDLTLKEVLELIDWYNNDLQEHIEKAYDGETLKITEGEMAREVMKKGKLLLKELKQHITEERGNSE